jgi:hypothetical protein
MGPAKISGADVASRRGSPGKRLRLLFNHFSASCAAACPGDRWPTEFPCGVTGALFGGRDISGCRCALTIKKNNSQTSVDSHFSRLKAIKSHNIEAFWEFIARVQVRALSLSLSNPPPIPPLAPPFDSPPPEVLCLRAFVTDLCECSGAFVRRHVHLICWMFVDTFVRRQVCSSTRPFDLLDAHILKNQCPRTFANVLLMCC